jgi:hypothetical protein
MCLCSVRAWKSVSLLRESTPGTRVSRRGLRAVPQVRGPAWAGRFLRPDGLCPE